MKYSIGQEIEFVKDFEIEKSLSGEIVKVKKGDKAVITSKNISLHTTGKAKGLMQKLSDDVKVSGYDHYNIATMILNRLNCVYNLEEFLDGEEIDALDFTMEIEDVLTDIL